MDSEYDSSVQLPDLVNCLDIDSKTGPGEMSSDAQQDWELASGAHGKAQRPPHHVSVAAQPLIGWWLCDRDEESRSHW